MSLTLENIGVVYGENTPFRHTALKDISIAFPKGKVTGIIGHTGSGKSTLAMLLNGLLKPTSGRVLLDGEDIWAKPKEIRSVRFRVGLVFQYPEYQLFDETVRADIAFGPKNMGLSAEECDSRVARAASFCGVDEKMLARSPFELSGGQKRRAAIAGVLAMDPEVLVLDEPAAGLDPRGREEILGGLMDYQKQRQSTMLIISHSMEDIAKYADSILVLKEGEVFLFGTVEEVFYDPRHPYTWALLSSLPQLMDRGTKLYSIAGTPPSLYNEIVGDAFAPRNEHALKIDFEMEPPFFPVSETHYAKTWLLDPRAPKLEKPEIIQDLHEKIKKMTDKGGAFHVE